MSFTAKQKYPDVTVRRGNIDLGRVNLNKIPDQLQDGKLLGSDRISLNGHTWFRLDKFPELYQVPSAEKNFFEKDISELVKKKYPDVAVRRGRVELGTINLKKVPDKIQEGKFRSSDRISINGETWYRLDKLPELKYFFLNKRIEEIQQRREKILQAAKILVPAAVSVLLAIAIYLLPYLTFYRIIVAIEDRDDRTFSRLIDPEAMKKSDMASLAGLNTSPQTITATGLRSLIELTNWAHLQEIEKKQPTRVSALPSPPPLRKEDIFPYAKLQYVSPTTFSVTVLPKYPKQPPLEMTLTRSFINWKITYISLFK